MAYQKEKETTPEGFIDLGEDYEKRFGGMCGAESASAKEENPKVYYPELRFEVEALRGLPKEGTAIIHYRKTMERDETVTNGDKTKKNYACEIEVHSIKPEKSEGNEGDEESSESTMDSNDEAIEKGLAAVGGDE